MIASGHRLIRHGATRDRLAHDQYVLCLDTEAADLKDAAQDLVIRGICSYTDLHSSKFRDAYAAVTAAAYAKEFLSLIPIVFKTIPLAASTYAEAASVLDALLLTRPEVIESPLLH